MRTKRNNQQRRRRKTYKGGNQQAENTLPTGNHDSNNPAEDST